MVDEAGLLSVDQAVALTEVARSAGAVLRLVGDPRQLGAVGRGGVMETAARWAPGGEVTLSQVHRFLRLQAGPDGLPLTVPDAGWADVCQQLREGAEPAGAAQALIERGAVVHQGRGEAVAAIAAEAAREAGREGALAVTAATNADARELNDAARGLRVAAGDVDDTVVATGMDGVRIGRGDRVVTRRNDNAAGVANREAWTVAAVRGDGSLVLKAKQRRVQLPAEYVAAAVQLGYAATDYGNQGVTATRSATWVSPATSAGGLYVGASRGRWENRLHVVAENVEEARDTLAGAVRRDRADRGLDAARAQAVAQSFPAPGKRKPGPAAVPEGWLSAAELAAALDSLDANLAAELARLRPVPVLDEDVWRSETETDRATAEAGRAQVARYEAEAGRAKAGQEEALEQARADFFQAREDDRVLAAGPGLLGWRGERVKEAQSRLAELAQRWGYPLPGARWGDQAVAEAAQRAAEAKLAQQQRFYEAEIDKAGHVAYLAEDRMSHRDARRAAGLGHNEAAQERRAQLTRGAELARAELAGERQRLVEGMAPEEVAAIDAARDAQRAERAGAQEVVRSARQARHRGQGWDLGAGRERPGPEREGPSGSEPPDAVPVTHSGPKNPVGARSGPRASRPPSHQWRQPTPVTERLTSVTSLLRLPVGSEPLGARLRTSTRQAGNPRSGRAGDRARSSPPNVSSRSTVLLPAAHQRQKKEYVLKRTAMFLFLYGRCASNRLHGPTAGRSGVRLYVKFPGSGVDSCELGVYGNPPATPARLKRRHDHREALDIVVALAHWGFSRPQCSHEIRQRPGDPVTADRCRRGFDALEFSSFASGRAHLGDRVAGAVPGGATKSPDSTPRRLPRGLEAVGAPAPLIAEAEPALELELCDRRRGTAVPAPRRVELSALHADGVGPGDVAGGIEGVDRHIDQQRAVHLIAEAPEVGRPVELGVELAYAS